MEKIAIFGDIHGNLPALEAVFSDMQAKHFENIFCLGDLVGYGTFPNEVMAAIRDRNIPTIMGNYDQGIGNSSDECGCAYKDQVSKELGKRSIAWTNEHTSAQNKAFLHELPASIPLKLGDLRLLLVHGSPRKINEYLYEDRPDAGLERLLDIAEADVLVCGHTHLPYRRILPSGREVINAGSVGKPKDGDPRAGYIVLSASQRHLEVDFIRVPYDIEQAAIAIEGTSMPAEYAQMLRVGIG